MCIRDSINIGTADNANDGDVLRAAFRKVRKMFAEIYGDTDAVNLTDTEIVPETNFDTHITEKIQDTVSGMFSNGTQTNVTVTYDDNDGSIDLNVAADITDVNAGDGLTGTNESGGAATLNVGAGTGITVNADDIQITDGGVGTTQLANDAVTADKLANSINSEIAANTAKVTNATHTGDVTGSTELTIANDVVDYDKLAGEFTTSTAIAGTAVDFSSAAVFTKTITGTTTLTFSSVETGMVKTLVISGNATLAMTGVTTLNGEYSGTASKNIIQIVSTNGSSEMFATISNVA